MLPRRPASRRPPSRLPMTAPPGSADDREKQVARTCCVVVEGVGRPEVAEVVLAGLVQGCEVEANPVAFLEHPAGGPDLDVELVDRSRHERLWIDVGVVRSTSSTSR